MPFFGQKLLSTQCGGDRYTHKSPVMKGENVFRVFKKSSLKPNTASHNNTNWYTDTDGFLQHSLAGKACTTRDPLLRVSLTYLEK